MINKKPVLWTGLFFIFGSFLLSHGLAAIVSSASEGLTAVFGMGTGVAPPVLPPKSYRY